MKEINIKPEMGIYRVFKYLKYSPWFALSEFIDNSLQSFISKKNLSSFKRDKCIVNIKFEDRKIIIVDNAFGISENEHSRAFTAGIPPSNNKGLSEFGVGMKSAAIWFAPKWKVKTQPYESNLEFEYIFDLNEITNSNGDIKCLVSDSTTEKGFTSIELINIYNKINGKQLIRIKRNLESIYRQFIREETLEINFNNEKLSFKDPELLEDHFYTNSSKLNNKKILWKKNVNFQLTNNAVIDGFVALRKRGSLEESGLSLFRRKRLILGNYKNLYKPKEIFGLPNSIQYQRIYGELNITGIDVSHTKDDFNFGSFEDEFIEKLKDELNKEELPILSQAINYRVKEFDAESLRNVLNELNELINKLNNNIQNLIENISLNEKFIFLKSKKYFFNHIYENELSKEFIVSDSLVKFNIKKKIYNIKFGIGAVNNNFGYEVFSLRNKEKIEKNIFPFFIVVNKNYKPLLNNKFSTDSKKYLLSNLIATSISELILLSLNINNIKKDRFLENGLLDLLYKN